MATCVPASYGGLDQGGYPHTEEDGPYQLAGGPLVVAHTHGVSQEEGDGDGAAKASQIVLVGRRRKEGVSVSEGGFGYTGLKISSVISLDCNVPNPLPFPLAMYLHAQ